MMGVGKKEGDKLSDVKFCCSSLSQGGVKVGCKVGQTTRVADC